MPKNTIQRGKLNKKKAASEFTEIKKRKEQVEDLQLEADLLKETMNVLKKDPGVDLKQLSNREKAANVLWTYIQGV